MVLVASAVSLLVVAVSMVPGASGETAAIPLVSGPVGGARPLLGALAFSPAARGSHTAATTVRPTGHFSFSYAAIATDNLQPVGTVAVPRTPLAAYQAAVSQRAIAADATPSAVPRTPLAAYQTAVAQHAILPNETPPAIVWLCPTRRYSCGWRRGCPRSCQVAPGWAMAWYSPASS
jgi:hypothetical protein